MQSRDKQFLELLKDRLDTEVVALLTQAQSPVAVACSGGPDSIAAALVAKALCPQPVTLLHFNHKLRGRKSDGDAKFVERFAKDIGAGFRVGVWKTPDKKNETAAREARLNFLHQWEHEIIVFGHHADDAVETLLMRLARGATIEGLCAPHAVNKMRNHVHVRPLINLRKKEIIGAMKKLKVSYRKDASNDGVDYLRNRIRNKLLPLWQKIETRDVAAGILAARENLKKLLPEKLKTAEDSCSETEVPSFVFVEAALPLGATVFFPSGASISAQKISAPDLEALRKSSDPLRRAYISASVAPLLIRGWLPGERYSPLGSGSRKIKEILNENCASFSPAQRAVWPLVVDIENTVLWLPGARITLHAAVKPSEAFAIELSFSPPMASLQKASGNDF